MALEASAAAPRELLFEEAALGGGAGSREGFAVVLSGAREIALLEPEAAQRCGQQVVAREHGIRFGALDGGDARGGAPPPGERRRGGGLGPRGGRAGPAGGGGADGW